MPQDDTTTVRLALSAGLACWADEADWSCFSECYDWSECSARSGTDQSMSDGKANIHDRVRKQLNDARARILIQSAADEPDCLLRLLVVVRLRAHSAFIEMLMVMR